MTPAAAPAEAAQPPGIRVEHSGDGTVVHGTEKGDEKATAALKAAGFKWSRNLDGWYLPRTWGEATRDVRVRQLEQALGDNVTVERGAAAPTTTAAERAQARIDRANELADKHTGRAEKAATEADVRFGRARAIGDMIPMGQPILVGHHSESRHRNDLAKIDTNMRKGWEAQGQSEQSTQRAESAAARARLETDPKAAARRLARSEAELRQVQRRLSGTGKEIHGEDTPAAGKYAEQLRARAAELTDQIQHDRSIAGDRVGPDAKFGKHNVAPGDVVVIKGRPHVVHSTGPKNAKVMTEVGPLPYAYTQVDSVQSLAAMSTDALERTLAKSQHAGQFGTGRRALPPAVVARIESILKERGDT